MKIGIIGAGEVAKTLAIGLSKNHQVVISSRNLDKNKAFYVRYPNIDLLSFKEAAGFGEIVINALSGNICIEVLTSLEDQLSDKILLDLANPLDFSKADFELFIGNFSSLGESIQKALPRTRVVKTLNMISAKLMINPHLIQKPHDMFICGNDIAAKQRIKDLLINDFGWQIFHDLGDIKGARAMESLLHLWLKLWGNFGHTSFNIHIANDQ